MSPRTPASALLCAILLCAGFARGQSAWPSDAELNRNWPYFRGSAAGIAGGDAPTDWDGVTGRNILFKTPIALPGKNSSIVWNDSIFLSGATKERQEVFCFDAASGSLRWQKTIGNPDPAKAPKVMEDAGYAASTMVTDGRRAFVIFATGDIAAIDFSGQIVWSKNLGLPDNQYGHSSSLAMWQNRLIVQYDQGLDAKAGKSELLALDAVTGSVVWKTPRPVANSWTSPLLISTATGPQIVTAANPWVISYEPQRGTELWRAKCLEGDVAPSPAYANGIVFVAMENSLGSAIKIGGSGDVSKSHVAWTAETSLPDIVSPLITGKYAFVATTFGTLTCYDVADGKKLWDHDFEGPLQASPLLVGDVVYLIDKKGIMQRFTAGREFKALNQPALGEAVSATPAIANHRIYIRGENHLFGIGPK